MFRKPLFILLLFVSCNPIPISDLMPLSGPEQNAEVVDFIPAVQPFVNEGCNTRWDNLSAIVDQNGEITYFTELPDYTPDVNDLDKNRFQFIYQVRNPWYGIFEEEEIYAHLQTGWYMLPISDYGNLTCEGLQEIRIWVKDKRTGAWYMNSQICWVAVLCQNQTECDYGYTFDQIEFVDYQSGFLYLTEGPISNN